MHLLTKGRYHVHFVSKLVSTFTEKTSTIIYGARFLLPVRWSGGESSLTQWDMHYNISCSVFAASSVELRRKQLTQVYQELHAPRWNIERFISGSVFCSGEQISQVTWTSFSRYYLSSAYTPLTKCDIILTDIQ